MLPETRTCSENLINYKTYKHCTLVHHSIPIESSLKVETIDYRVSKTAQQLYSHHPDHPNDDPRSYFILSFLVSLFTLSP
jgi:hypothetical protein